MRGLLCCVLALLCGVYTICLCPVVGVETFLFWMALVFCLAALLYKKARLPFLILLFFLVGFLQAGYRNDIQNRPLYPYEDEFVTVTADVIREPENREEDGSYLLHRFALLK